MNERAEEIAVRRRSIQRLYRGRGEEDTVLGLLLVLSLSSSGPVLGLLLVLSLCSSGPVLGLLLLVLFCAPLVLGSERWKKLVVHTATVDFLEHPQASLSSSLFKN